MSKFQFNIYYDGIRTPRNKNKQKTITVRVGKHFKQRFAERWSNQQDVVKYLNEHLPEGCLVADVVADNGLYFPIASLYVPISTQHGTQKDYFAITFQFKIVKEYHKPVKVNWVEYKEEEKC